MRIIIIAVLLSLSVPGWAAFRTGNTLMELVPGYKKVSGTGAAGATDYMSATDLRSYVTGVYDGLEGFNVFCSPNNTSTRQITNIVILYLENHPEQWDWPANEIIAAALKEAFPCSQDKPDIKGLGGD
jgi:hypothetical protein